ncbi:MAG: endonuclease [Prevotella sp.]|nr:endonuclease [Prevotella sp.]
MNIATLLLGIFTFVELNCENLFDCDHDSLKDDTEWTAEGMRHWTKKRYWKKVNNIGREIIACGEDGEGWALPDMAVLTEVENDSVLRDLTKRSLLRNAHYEYLMTESPDLRGIDVAILYSPMSFCTLRWYPIRVEPRQGMRPTRDILYASGIVGSGDTLHVFAVHAPSRFGGEKETRPYRMAVAERLCQAVDSIRSINHEAQIIVAGDFNDTHSDPALLYCYEHGLQNIAYKARGRHGAEGTYKYQGDWSSIDNILGSETLAQKVMQYFVADKPYLLEEDKNYGGVKPRRTFYGYTYDGDGYSDHLPLVLKLRF